LNSTLAGEASAKFSVLLGDAAAFDCRISQLPQIEDVVDYFRWQSEDEHQNALNGHCYWTLDQQRKSVEAATTYLLRVMSGNLRPLTFHQRAMFFRLALRFSIQKSL
jgi:tRNA(His) 5'-end guanylyltransferase